MLKKSILIAITLSMILTSSVSVYAASESLSTEIGQTQPSPSSEKENISTLEAAILRIKQINPETSKYDKFDYDLYDGSDGSRYYNLYWSDTGNKLPQITASVNSSGMIVSYSVNNVLTSEDWNRYSFPNITKDTAVKAAFEFVSNVAPEIAPDMSKNHVTVSYNRYDGSYSVEIKRVRNGIEIKDERVNITVSNSGSVTSYNARSISDNVLSEASVKSLDGSQILSSFKSNIPLNLRYHSVYDSENNKYTVKLSYFVDDYTSVINAETGEKYTLEYTGDSYKYYGFDSAVEEETAAQAGASENGSLSGAEKKAVENNEKLLKPEDVKNKLGSMDYIEFDNTLECESSYLFAEKSQYTDNITYYLTCRFVKETDGEYLSADVTLNAETGEIKNYSFYNGKGDYPVPVAENGNSDKPVLLSDIESSQKAKDAVSKLFTYSNEYRINEDDYFDDKSGTAYYSFTRYHENIPFDSNNISISVNRENGKINSISAYHSPDVVFPSSKGIVSNSTAIENYFKLYPMNKIYIPVIKSENNVYTVTYNKLSADEKQLVPVYKYNYGARIDAITGKVYNEWGNEEAKYEAPVYYYENAQSKIGNTPQSDKIATLYNMDIIDIREDFNAGKLLTKREFTDMINMLGYGFSDSLKNISSYKDEDILKRKDAVIVMIDALGYSDIAKYSDIFKFDTTLYGEIPSDLTGYYAIAQALGLLEDFGTDLKNDSPLTVADASSILYNFILFKNSSEQ